MEMHRKYSDHVVEDGFSFEEEGHQVGRFRQYFKGLPKDILQRLLTHFNNRKEWEVCKIIRELIPGAPTTGMA